MLLKGGIFFDNGDFSAGMTVTTPSVSLFGLGTMYTTVKSINANAPQDFSVADNKDGLATTVHSPFSVGGGAGYRIGNVRLHASVEFFAGISAYELMDNQLRLEASDTTIILRPTQAARAIVNAGLGLEVKVSENVDYFFSAILDQTSVDQTERRSVALSSWDIYHVNSGFLLTNDNIALTLGLGFALGTDEEQPRALDGTVSPTAFLDANTKFFWARLRALIGFTYTV